MSFSVLLQNLGYDKALYEGTKPPKEIEYKLETGNMRLEIVESGKMYRVVYANVDTEAEKWWNVETRLVMSDEDLEKLAYLIVRLVPPFTSVCMQADTHSAGNVFVGLVMHFDHQAIPINLVSGDIGCGLTLIPMARDGVQMEANDQVNQEWLSWVLWNMRYNLKRGRVSEEGKTLNTFLKEAMSFYGKEEFQGWLSEMKYILDMTGISYANDRGVLEEELGADEAAVLNHIGRFAQSLGSSGNHFMELSKDERGYLWMVVHSGSRSLGYKVYSVIADAARLLSDGLEIATGPLAEFYTRAHHGLMQFAKLNRVICAVAVLKALGFDWDGRALAECMAKSYLFDIPMDSKVRTSLLSGLTHNGIKAFVNHEEKRVAYVLCKGSIAVSAHASSSIVALKAGEGCLVWTLVDETCPWVEVGVAEAVALGYETICDIGQTHGGVVLAGHGAGRRHSAKKTADGTTFDKLREVFEAYEMVGNIAPGVLGDHPQDAYKDIHEILPTLPLDRSRTCSWLKTLVSYKEGLVEPYKKDSIKRCGDYIQTRWSMCSCHEKLWLDLNSARYALTTEFYETARAETVAIAEGLRRKFLDQKNLT